MEVVRNNKGGIKLCFGGFMYTKKSQSFKFAIIITAGFCQPPKNQLRVFVQVARFFRDFVLRGFVRHSGSILLFRSPSDEFRVLDVNQLSSLSPCPVYILDNMGLFYK